MKVRNVILLINFAILAGCDPSDNRLKFFNHTNLPVIVEISNDSTNFEFNNIAYYKRNIVLKDSNFVFRQMGSNHAMVDYIGRNQHEEIFLVVFSLDSVNKYQNQMDLNILFKKKNTLL